MFEALESDFAHLLLYVRLLVEAVAAFWIVVGVGYAVVGTFNGHLHSQPESFKSVRLRFSRYLSLALEFQLAADLLSTAIAPTYEELGRLAIIAVIRTFLNYFLSREIQEEQVEMRAARGTRVERPPDAYHPIPPPAVRA
jgi:uncharacterized membrane protein